MQIVIFKKYLKSILVTILILFLSFSTPSSFKKLPDMNLFEHFDKVVHFFMYFLLAFMLIWESKSSYKMGIKPKVFFVICIVYPVVLGGVIEIMQKYFFPPRTAEWLDWTSNLCGVLSAWLIISIFQKIKAGTT